MAAKRSHEEVVEEEENWPYNAVRTYVCLSDL